jgi:hypothetical protein
MKVLEFLIRAGLSLSIAFAISFSSAVIFFDYTEYQNTLDRFMLVTIPTLAIGFLLFENTPKIWAWLKQRNLAYLITATILTTIIAIETVFTVGTSRVYWMSAFSYTLTLLTLILPALPALERLSKTHSVWHYIFGATLSFSVIYPLMGYISGILEGRFHLIVLTTLWMIPFCIVSYPLMSHIAWSRKHGFLKNWLNVIMVILPPFFIIIIFNIVSQFPKLFSPDSFKIPTPFWDVYLSSTLVASAWAILLSEQFEVIGLYQKFQKTKLFTFIKENIAGIYIASIFFFVNLILARTFNITTYSFNSIIFEADAGPWYAILGLPEGYNVNRAVHPLTLITIRPFVRFFGLFVGESWFLAPLIGIALTNAFAILMAFIFVKRATQNETYAYLFAMLLGASGSHIIFGSITETYVFGMASLIFFLLLVQADEKRFSILVPAGLLVFGITVTNIAQSMIALLTKKTLSFWRWFYYGVIVLTLSIALTAFVNILYPGNQSSFWVPEDILFEAQFSKPIYEKTSNELITRTQIVSRTMFLYGVLAPTPVETIRGRNTPTPIVNFKTYHYKDAVVAWYNGLANIPLVIWIIGLLTATILFLKNLRTDANTPLTTGILGSIAFNFLLHLNYGTELFLYTPYFTFLVIFFVALTLKPLANKRWFEILTSAFVLMVFLNSAQLIYTLLTGLSLYLKGGG